jgi:hypothetical protein
MLLEGPGLYELGGVYSIIVRDRDFSPIDKPSNNLA